MESCSVDSLDVIVAQLMMAVPPGLRWVDIGSGDGLAARRIAALGRGAHLTMVDPHEVPSEGAVSCPERHIPMSVIDPALLLELKGQVDAISSFRTFHEFKDPARAADHLLQLFPRQGNGMVLIIDYARAFWSDDRLNALSEPRRRHMEADWRNVQRTGLYENADIFSFWESALRKFGLVPLLLNVTMDPALYLVLCTGEGDAWKEDIPVPVG